MSGNDKDPHNEDKKKHLEFLLQIISRMSSNSFLLKGWSITINAALMTIMVKNDTTNLCVIGLVVSYLFWCLDAYYLGLERKFRFLYDLTRKLEITDFSIDISNVNDKKCNLFNAFVSLNLVLFYLMLMTANILIIFLLK